MTTQPSGARCSAPEASTSLSGSRLDRSLLWRQTTSTPAAPVVSFEAAVLAVTRPPSMITAISFSAMVRRLS